MVPGHCNGVAMDYSMCDTVDVKIVVMKKLQAREEARRRTYTRRRVENKFVYHATNYRVGSGGAGGGPPAATSGGIDGTGGTPEERISLMDFRRPGNKWMLPRRRFVG